MADNPPNLTIASSQSEQEIATERAMREIGWATRQLSANMLRIIRGAGRPHDLFDQVRSLAGAIDSSPPGTLIWRISEAMELALAHGLKCDDDDFDRDSHLGKMESGSLRAVAARLLGQPLQVSAGRRELEQALIYRDQFFEMRTKRMAEARRTSITPKRVTSIRRVAQKKAKSKPPVVAAAAHVAEPAAKMDYDEKPASTADFMRQRAREIAEAAKQDGGQ
jgi:hypothetical protein